MTRRPVRCTLASVLILALTSLGEAPAQSSRPASKRHHWAFRTLASQVVPRVRQAEQVRTPLDAFVVTTFTVPRARSAGAAGERSLAAPTLSQPRPPWSGQGLNLKQTQRAMIGSWSVGTITGCSLRAR